MTARIHAMDMSEHARAEFVEAITYISRESPENARAVQQAIRRKISQLRRFPESAPADPEAPAPPEGATLRVAHVSGFVIRYAFPMRRGGNDMLYVVSIQRASRPPLDDMDFVDRFLQEAAPAYAQAETRDEPSELERIRAAQAARGWTREDLYEERLARYGPRRR